MDSDTSDREDNHFDGRDTEIVLSNATKSKAYRLLSVWEVKQAVQELDGILYRRGDSAEYHLVNQSDGFALSLREDGERIIVITQMHIHNDYEELETYQKVDRIDE